jgi:uncharacterized protein (DUF58 family)
MQRLAAALGCVALARYDSVTIGVLNGTTTQVLPRLRGKNETSCLLAILEGLQPRGSIDLASSVRSYCGSRRRGVGILISDLMAPSGTAEAVAALRRVGLEPVVLQVLAREECEPKLEGPLELVDCETGVLLSTAINGEALKAYGERFAGWTAELDAACTAQHAALVRLYTDQPIEDLLFAALRGRVVQ